MKTIYLLAVFIGVLPGLAGAKEILQLGYLEYPPLVYSAAENTPAGPIVDFIEKNLGQEFTIRWGKIPVGRVQWAFENGLINAYPFMVYVAEREEYAYFFKKPYLLIQPKVCSKRKFSKPTYTQAELAEVFAGKVMIYPLNSKELFAFLHDERLTLTRLPYDGYFSRSLQLIELGRADFVFFNTIAGREEALTTAGLNCVDASRPIGVYFAFRKGDALATKVERLLEPLAPLRY